MASKNNFTDLDCFTTVTIANSGTTSGEADLIGTSLCGIIMPAAFTGTSLTFQVSNASGGTYQTLYDSTNATISVAVTQGRSYSLNPTNFAAWRYIKVVSGSSEGAARDIILVSRQI